MASRAWLVLAKAQGYEGLPYEGVRLGKWVNIQSAPTDKEKRHPHGCRFLVSLGGFWYSFSQPGPAQAQTQTGSRLL
jgi:hypothetical protein